jgi:hypothetical protein
VRLKIAQRNLLSDALSLRQIDKDGREISPETIRTTTWVADSPSSYTVVTDVFYRSDRYSLKLTNSTSQNTTIRATQTQVPWPHIREPLIFSAMVLNDSGIQVSTYIHPPTEAYTTVEPNTQDIEAGVWSAIFSNEYTFGSDEFPYGDVSITVVLGTRDTDSMYFTTPCLTLAQPEKFNQLSQNSIPYFPDIVRDMDAESQNPTRPLGKIYHSLTADMSQIIDRYIQLSNLEHEEVGHASVSSRDHPYNILTRSELTDPDLMLPEYLEWAAMLVGTRLARNIYLGESPIYDLDNFDFQRWQVKSKAFGHAAGSRAAVRAAASTVLTGQKFVIVTPVYNGDPWVIGIRTLNTETPDASVAGDESSSVLAAAEAARPAGFVFKHESVDVIAFILDSSDFGVFDQNVLG